MKKFLSLVLALVMTMSLVTISAGATFTDDDKIDYKEAVEVMKAVKVIDGYANGAFNPTNTLTRGAAAKIICNLLLGPTTADALVATSAPYTDVAADSTFAGYIAYCKSQGIINGYSDGSFKPGATLNGFAFMKMLLGALGFDPTIEGYVGTNWSIAVAKQAKNFDLYKGNSSFNGTKAVTREEACLYALNALQARPVEYDDKGTTITVGGIDIVTGASKWDYESADPTDLYMHKLFGTDLVKTPGDTDDFGRNATTWTYKGDDVGTFGETADYTFTLKTSAKDVAAALKGVKDANGYKIENDTTVAAYGKTAAKNFADTYTTTNGKLVEVFVNDEKQITDVVTVSYTVGKVTKVSTNSKTGDVTYTIDNGAGSFVDYADEDKTDEIILNGEIKKDDYVTFKKINSSKIYVYTTTEMEGVVSKANSADYIVLDGVKYPQSASIVSDKSAKKVWVDQFGVAVRGEAVDNSTDYVYVTGKWNESNKGVRTYYVQVVTAEGEVKELKVKDSTVDATIAVDTVITYTTDSGKIDSATTYSSGEVVYLTPGSNVKEGAAKLIGGTNAASTYYFADDVTLVYLSKKSGDDLKVTTSNTVDKISGIAVNSYAILDDGEVIAMFIRDKAATSTKGEDMLFMASTSVKGNYVNKDGDKVDTYEFYLNGEKDEYGINSGSAKVGYFTYSVDGTTGDLDLTWEKDNIFKVTVGLNGSKAYGIAKDTYVNLNGIRDEAGNALAAGHDTDAVLADDAVIYDTTSNGITTLADIVSTVEDDVDVDGLYLYVVYDTKAENITTIYVVGL